MREPKFDVGDVVRINHGSFKENDGTLATVKAVWQTNGSPYDVLKLETVGGWRLEVLEYMVVGVPLEEVQRYYADKPRRDFMVDGLTVDEALVDEMESGQDEAYQTFRTAANEANREELRREAEEARKEVKVLAELIATGILWAVLTLVSIVMWVIVRDRTGEMLFTLIGMVSAEVGFLLMVKTIGTLVGAAIALCRERCKALRERRKRGHGGEDPHNMG
jgi:hypothetical protein